MTITIRTELEGGDLGRIVAMHGSVYRAEMDFDITFEAYVAQTVAEYVLVDHCRGRVWLAERAGELVGCTAVINRDDDVWQLRWVLVDPSARGIGLGKELVDAAIAYAGRNGCRQMYLLTTDGLDASQAIYGSRGFRVVEESVGSLGGRERKIIRMSKQMGATSSAGPFD